VAAWSTKSGHGVTRSSIDSIPRRYPVLIRTPSFDA
jgi:hypothetical protein